jgi:protoporphyrin/coproporphyrin ferrochelatase
MAREKMGLLVMAYGTPSSLDEVEAYYTHIRRGNPPTPEKLQELINRYEAIGGLSPLNEITRKQVKNLENFLNEKNTSVEFTAYMGMKHAHPFIEDAIEQMAKDNLSRAVGIVLAPHYSSMSVGAYYKTAQEAAKKYGIKLEMITDYHLEPHFIQALTERVEETLERFPVNRRNQVHVLFTAHSLPARILEQNDPYPNQLRETAEAVANQLNLEHWDTGWQSAGQTAVPWLGPDILDHMKNLRKEGVMDLLICPIGFVSDHLEILYDIDIECKNLAKELGTHLERTTSLNADPLYIQALASAVFNKLESNIKG